MSTSPCCEKIFFSTIQSASLNALDWHIYQCRLGNELSPRTLPIYPNPDTKLGSSERPRCHRFLRHRIQTGEMWLLMGRGCQSVKLRKFEKSRS